MLDLVLNTALLFQTLFQPLVSLKYSVSFKVAFRVKIFLKKYTLKIYLGKLGKNGDFTILNKLLEPYRSSYQRRSVKKMFLREGYTVKFFFQSISFVLMRNKEKVIYKNEKRVL